MEMSGKLQSLSRLSDSPNQERPLGTRQTPRLSQEATVSQALDLPQF